MGKTGKTGVKTGTPEKIFFGAGTIHKNLKYTVPEGQTAGSWNFEESIMGATQGGSSISIIPELVDIEADGVLVPTKGLKKKVGETAEMEINFLEITKEIIKSAVIGNEVTSPDNEYNHIVSKADISEGDYYDNIAFVGKTLAGKNIIVIIENVLCTSGLEKDNQNKEAGVLTCTFACHADLDSDLDSLPYHIYYPKASA